MKRRILLFMMTALLSVGAWAADDLTLNVEGITQFDGYGLSNQSGSSFTVGNWANVGWEFGTALSQDDYYGVEFTVTASTANAKLKIIYDETYTYTENDEEKTANYEQVIDIPSGNSTIVTHFSYDYKIKKIGFREHSDNSTNITVTSAVVKAHADGDLTLAKSGTILSFARWTECGWSFGRALDKDKYYGIEMSFTEVNWTNLSLKIKYANESVQEVNVDKGSTTLSVLFNQYSNITGIYFYYNDYSNDDGSDNNATINFTSAVVKAESEGERVNLDLSKLSDTTDGVTTLTRYSTYASIGFTPIYTNDYEKAIVTFSTNVANDNICINAESTTDSWSGTTLGTATKGTTKAVVYFSEKPDVDIKTIGFYYGYSGDEGSTATLQVSGITLVKKTEFVRTITDALYATTSFPAAVDFSQTDGIKAYIATVNAAKTKVELTEVTKVAAGVPVILNGSATDYTLHYTTESTDDVSGNNLLVSDGTVTGDGSTIYVLANKTSNGVGFYKFKNGSTVPAGKVYLQISGGSGARAFIGFGDDNGTTGIQTIDNGKLTNDNGYYDLQGRRVAQPTKGLYIVNGKKVIIK